MRIVFNGDIINLSSAEVAQRVLLGYHSRWIPTITERLYTYKDDKGNRHANH